ncbi:protein of unknown function DUF2470 [Dillenia turbinata]|uniref:DUF2470 domain-containing protein n=1 Tax=Dillenia turbinata TaxID=194707 RepID=A0AAN8WB89_9MAGN
MKTTLVTPPLSLRWNWTLFPQIPRIRINNGVKVKHLQQQNPKSHHHRNRLSIIPSSSPASTSTPLHNYSSLSSSMASFVAQTVTTGDAAVTSEAEPDVYQLIQSHQKAAARLPPVEEVRTLLDRTLRGMLSTFSQKYEGYPSGSLVDFACDSDGSPILVLTSLAFHTQNILANSKCSLLVAKDPDDRSDVLITLYGDAILVPEGEQEAIRSTYLAKHPDAFWVDFGGFRFFHIEPKVVRFVSGVATALLGSGEFSKEEYKMAQVDPIAQFSKPVASHMNKDHADDTKLIVQHSTSIMVDSAYMLDLDSLGFNVKVGYQGNTLKLRIPFPRRAVDRKDVKTLIVEMLHAAKAEVAFKVRDAQVPLTRGVEQRNRVKPSNAEEKAKTEWEG